MCQIVSEICPQSSDLYLQNMTSASDISPTLSDDDLNCDNDLIRIRKRNNLESELDSLIVDGYVLSPEEKQHILGLRSAKK